MWQNCVHISAKFGASGPDCRDLIRIWSLTPLDKQRRSCREVFFLPQNKQTNNMWTNVQFSKSSEILVLSWEQWLCHFWLVLWCHTYYSGDHLDHPLMVIVIDNTILVIFDRLWQYLIALTSPVVEPILLRVVRAPRFVFLSLTALQIMFTITWLRKHCCIAMYQLIWGDILTTFWQLWNTYIFKHNLLNTKTSVTCLA